MVSKGSIKRYSGGRTEEKLFDFATASHKTAEPGMFTKLTAWLESAITNNKTLMKGVNFLEDSIHRYQIVEDENINLLIIVCGITLVACAVAVTISIIVLESCTFLWGLLCGRRAQQGAEGSVQHTKGE